MKILCVCEDPLLSKNIKNELEDAGYLVTVMFENPDKIVDQSLSYDLILISLGISFIEANELCSEIRMSESNQSLNAESIPIIMLTKDDSLEQRIKSSEAGAQELIEVGVNGRVKHRVDSFLKPDMVWQGMKALVVEDDAISAKYIRHVLRSKGLDVVVLKDGLEAYDYVKENPNLDIVLTDHMMPKLTGIEFIERVRGELGMKDLPVIFISSIQTPKEVLSFYKAGGNDYLSKPIIKEELSVKLSQHLSLRMQSKQLKDQVSQLEELNSVKDRFIAVCSHDLRAPLNLIMGLSDMMATDESGELDYKGLSKTVLKSSESLLELVEELLSLSEVQLKKEKMDVEKLELSKVVSNCLSAMETLNQKNINFKYRDDSNGASIVGNEPLLARLFTNLLSNAYKFTGKDGGVIVKLYHLENRLNASIQDFGIGMPEDMKEKIFESMSGIGRQGTEGEKSTGLGMSIVKDIVDKHGANISVESVEGEGTTFTISFDSN